MAPNPLVESAVGVTPIPTWVVTGPLGSGKTTLIAHWLAKKRADENWVVLLNEYTDAGIDALTVAASAQGAYDVRLVPGGCLCCAGEADFRRNLKDLIEHVRPAGILVEPSGIGHPGGLIEELLAHESAGGIELCGVIGLMAPSQIDHTDETTVAVREVADVLVLTKSDLASPEERVRFRSVAEGLFPPKRWTGEIEGGALPAEALRRSARVRASMLRPPSHEHEHGLAEQRGAAADASGAAVDDAMGRRDFHQLGRHGARWVFPRSVSFMEMRLLTLLSSDLSVFDPRLTRPERFKAVVRVDEDTWLLVQMVDGRLSMQPTAWRRDNRIEVQLPSGAEWDGEAWDRLWARCQRPVTPAA